MPTWEHIRKDHIFVSVSTPREFNLRLRAIAKRHDMGVTVFVSKMLERFLVAEEGVLPLYVRVPLALRTQPKELRAYLDREIRGLLARRIEKDEGK